VFRGLPYHEGTIPAMVTDVAKAKQMKATVKVTSKSFGVAYILTFAAIYFLNYAKELLWGSIRVLQTIFTMTLILFPQNQTMTTFMSGMSNFAS
jgi:hypothetical protein